MEFEEAFKLLDAAVVVNKQRHLKDIEVVVLRGSWQGKKYHEIAETNGYTAEYLKQDVGPKLWKLLSEILGEKVSKTNFLSAIERRWRFCDKIMAGEQTTPPNLGGGEVKRGGTGEGGLGAGEEIQHPKPQIQNRTVWGEAADVAVFYGRKEELAVLEDWIVRDRCQLVALLGMGGIGKTALAVRSAKQIQDEFEYIIWRSLLHAPPIEDLLTDLLKFFFNQPEINLPTSLDDRLSQLLYYLRSSRCLLVLDRAETILCGGENTGYYQPGYEGYGELIKQLGQTDHNSCLVLTSREKPKEITLLEGQKVRSLQLNGLNYSEIKKILSEMDAFSALEAESKLTIKRYSENALALKIAATLVRDLLDSNISKFNDLQNVLEQKFNRLTDI